jgi:hypothetical protein
MSLKSPDSFMFTVGKLGTHTMLLCPETDGVSCIPDAGMAVCPLTLVCTSILDLTFYLDSSG